MNDWYNKQTMIHLLTRDWFVDDESVCNTLNHADAEAWEWILQNRNKFSSRIQKNIELIETYYSPIQVQTVKVTDISDSSWNEIRTKHRKDMEAEFEMLWRDYVKTTPLRPRSQADDVLDKVSQKIKQEHETMEKHIDMQKKKYLTPAARLKNVDTRLQQLQFGLRTLQQEYDRTAKIVQQLEEEYHKNKKAEFRLKWLTA